ncbi:MAG: hypothetical protein JWM68_2474 [Verrucomicrobiales bacterium]|nr:hypothetical protein [Verrucomicrobiales bacterium]
MNLRKLLLNPWFLAGVLALVTIALYWPVHAFAFTNWDDDHFIINNPHVTGGLTQENIRWAFSSEPQFYWRPLTWLSLMTDAHFFGTDAGGFHVTNLALHLFSTLLLFAALNKMTALPWRSAIVAGLFAWHPLHVEAVAWISDRVDVLSGFFWMLALFFYAHYAIGLRAGKRKWPAYILTIVAFTLGLMCKPTIVTFPCVLLLLDYWPLRRFDLKPWDWKTLAKCVGEKIPFFLLALVAGLMAYRMQKADGLVMPVPLSWRIGNSIVSYVLYLWKTIWPSALSPYYPHAGQWPTLSVAICLLILITITIAAVWVCRRRPFVLIGWLFFVGSILPVIGLIQVGNSSTADRYSYLPHIGLFIALVWIMAEVLSSKASIIIGCLVLPALIIATRLQVSHWRNSLSLFTHALTAVPDNGYLRNNLGHALLEMSRYREAEPHLLEAVRFMPNHALSRNNLAFAQAKLKKLAEAEESFALAATLDSANFSIQYEWGNALFNGDKGSQAREHYLAAVKLNPLSAESHYQLGTIFSREHDDKNAALYFRKAVHLNSKWIEALNNLSWLLSTSRDDSVRNGVEALELARTLATLTPATDLDTLDTLAAAQAEVGQFDEAVRNEQRAVELAESTAAPRGFTTRLQLYQSKQPYHQH